MYVDAPQCLFEFLRLVGFVLLLESMRENVLQAMHGMLLLTLYCLHVWLGKLAFCPHCRYKLLETRKISGERENGEGYRIEFMV